MCFARAIAGLLHFPSLVALVEVCTQAGSRVAGDYDNLLLAYLNGSNE